MSKARIVESLGSGKYKVKLLLDVEAIKELIEELDVEIDNSNYLINFTLENKVTKAKADLDHHANDTRGPQYDLDPVTISRMWWLRHILDNALKAVVNEKIRRESMRNEKGKLEEVLANAETLKTVWCADFTEDLAVGSEVGVIDWYQYRGNATANKPVIMPAYIEGTESAYKGIRDGRLAPQRMLSTNSWWYAMMICAGLERYNPRYRKATITVIHDNGLCDVTVDKNYTQLIEAEAKKLTTKELFLKNVPVRYLTCDCLAFEVNDRVVLEYPRKDVHAYLVAGFKAKREDLIKKSTKTQAEITALEGKITAKNAEIDVLNQQAETQTTIIKNEADAAGITALQTDIDALDQQESTLKDTIKTATSDKESAEAAVAQLIVARDEKQAQIDTLNDDLDQLIANNAPPEDIAAKELQITLAINELIAINQDLQDASQLLADATATLNDSEINLRSVQKEKSDKQALLIPLLSQTTLAKDELRYILEKIVYETQKLIKLQDEKFGIETRVTGIEGEIIRLQELENKEQAKSAKLKKFTDTRPKEITVVGFESNPRRCDPPIFITYTNKLSSGLNTIIDNPPWCWNKSERIVYKKGIVNPIVKNDFFAGKDYWISKGGMAISWYKDTVYWKGDYFVLTANKIICCAYKNKTLITVEFDSVNHYSINTYLHEESNFTFSLSSSRIFFTGAGTNINNYDTIVQAAFLTDATTLVAIMFLQNSCKSVFNVFRFAADYQTESKEEALSGTGDFSASFYNNGTEFLNPTVITNTYIASQTNSPTVFYIDKDIVYVVAEQKKSESYINYTASSDYLIENRNDIIKENNSVKLYEYKDSVLTNIVMSLFVTSSANETASSGAGYSHNKTANYSTRELVFFDKTKNLSIYFDENTVTNNNYSVELDKYIINIAGTSKLTVEFKNNKTVVFLRNILINVIQQDTFIMLPNTIGNSSGSGPSNIDMYKKYDYAFDGKLFILAFYPTGDDNDNGKTIIIDITKTQLSYSILDYRVDIDFVFDENHVKVARFFPLSVTQLVEK